MKNIARIATAACLALTAAQAFAGGCYIHAQVLSTTSKAQVVLDVMRVDIPYYTNDDARIQLNQPESDSLKARAIAFVKKNAKRIDGATDASATYDKAKLSYGSACFRDEIRAAEMRDIDAKGNALLHGSWTLEKVAPVSAKESAAGVAAAKANASRSTPALGPVLTRSYDSSRPTPEQVAEQNKRDAARKKTEDATKAAAKSKADADAAAYKVAEDKRRQICLQPQHQGDCGCGKYLPPDPTRKVCSK